MGKMLPALLCAAPLFMGNVAPMTSMMMTPTFSFRCPGGDLIEATPQSRNTLKIAVVQGPNRNRLSPQVLNGQPRKAPASATRFVGQTGQISFVLPDHPERDPATIAFKGQKPQQCQPAPSIRN